MVTKKQENKSAVPDAPVVEDKHLQEVNEEIYKHSLELEILIKTLSLLRKLYQISLLSLDSASLSEKISETVRVDLNMETVGIFIFDQPSDTLTASSFAKSERLNKVLAKLGFIFREVKIENVSKKPILNQVVYDKNWAKTSKLDDIWGGAIENPKLKVISEESHLKTILLYPLVTQNRTLGALLLGLNRDYETMNRHEQDSINSLIDVVAVGLDRAQLHEQLKIANEKLKVLDQARAEFITIASHQLRTPPATIKWYLAAILDGDYGKFDDAVKEQLRKTASTNNSMIALIDDLLNASRIERGKMEFVFVPTNMVEITQITVDQLLPQAEMRKLNLVFVKPSESFPIISADKEKLRQVINNLIDNAIKYTEKGKIEVVLSQTPTDVVLKVTDSGRGVSPEGLKDIFQKYDRGKTPARTSAGLGLGLYVAKVIIEQHKGKIWVESPGVGKGSSFIFSIPIKEQLANTEFDLAKGQTTVPPVQKPTV